MLPELNLTAARSDFSSLYDKAYRQYHPILIRRRRDEEVLMLRRDLVQDALRAYPLKAQALKEPDGSITLIMPTLELVANGPTREKALDDLVAELKAYAQDFFSQSALFFNAPNRRHHFPFLLRVLLCNSDEEIRSLIEISNAA